MWATNATHMLARITGSTLFANHNVASIFTYDHRTLTTTTTTTTLDNMNIITKMRDLRARSPYILFVKDNFKEISAKNPNLKLVDISRKVAEVWKNLPNETKQTYIQKYQDQKANYEEVKKNLSPNDLQTIDADEKAKRIANRIKKSIQQLPTKKPRTAYAHYLSSLNRGEADLGTFMKGAAQRWSQMTAEDKQKFEYLHLEEEQKYVKDLVAWAAANDKKSELIPRRSVSTTSTKKKVRTTSATGRRTVKKRATSALKPVTSTTKSTKIKKNSDKETSSSSSDEEATTTKPKRSVKTNDSITS